MTGWRRSPRPLAFAVEALRDELVPATRLARVQTVWEEVVGAAIAAEATPTAERAGVLTITCSAAVWAQELDLMGPQIVARLGARLPEVAIERLRCVSA